VLKEKRSSRSAERIIQHIEAKAEI